MNHPHAEYQLVAKVDCKGNIQAPKFNVSFYDDFNAFISEDFDNFTEITKAVNRDNIVGVLYVITANDKDAEAIFNQAKEVGLWFDTSYIPAEEFQKYEPPEED